LSLLFRSLPTVRWERFARLALTASFAASAAACGGEEAPELATARVERGAIERIVVATGTIEPVKEVEVRPRIAGIIEHIHVSDGDDVTPGQLLLEIERELLTSQVAEAQAALDEARIHARYAAIDLRRAQELRKSGAASEEKLDAARSLAERSRASVARAEAGLATLETKHSYASVTSPLAGRVLEVHVEEGSAVSSVTSVTGGTLLLSLAATDTLHLEGLVDENEVARVRVGQPARIRTEAYGGRIFEGEVREIAPLGERIQNVTYFEVEIEISAADASILRPRMSGDAEIVAEVVDDAVLIPETALRYRGDQVYVEMPNGDGQPAERDIRIGIVDGARVQVLEGLEPGDEVVLP
jgi:RND family efflux transporter MFP subunit